MTHTIGGLATTNTNDLKKIIKEINKIKKSKQHNKLTALYNMLAQNSEGIKAIEALEKAKQYHCYCGDLDAINTYLELSDIHLVTHPLKAKLYLDDAQAFLEKLSHKDRMRSIIDLCQMYLHIESPLDVIDLARSVKRANDEDMFAIQFLKAKAQRQMQRLNDALDTVNGLNSILSLSNIPKYRLKILSEMSKIYGELGDYDNESKLKAQYFHLKNKEEVLMSEDSLSDIEIDHQPQIMQMSDIKVIIHHKCPFLNIHSFDTTVSSCLSRDVVQTQIIKETLQMIKMPKAVVKQVKIPKLLNNFSEIHVYLSNSSLPSIHDLYSSTVKPSNNKFATLLKQLDFNVNSYNFSMIQLKDADFQFISQYLPSKVTSLQLQHNFLTGEIFTFLTKFNNLRELDISNNCISGSFSISAISTDMTCWMNANIIDLSSNATHLTMDLTIFNIPSALDALMGSNILNLSLRESEFKNDSYFSLKSALKQMPCLQDLDLSGIVIESDQVICLECIQSTIVTLKLDLTKFTEKCNYEFHWPRLSILSVKSSRFDGKSEKLFIDQLVKFNIRQIQLQDTLINKVHIDLLSSYMLVRQ